jgi:DNA-binding NarL/FixJ family response regulator
LRQGRWDDAERLFRQSPSQPQSRLGLATLMLERGNAAESAEIAGEFLLHLSEDEATARVAALEILVRANVALSKESVAALHLEELERIGTALGTDPVLGLSAAARATLMRHRGDSTSAIRCMEAAAELFQKSGAPYETARARLELAELLAEMSRFDAAGQQAAAALESFTRLDCRAACERAVALLGRLGPPGAARGDALTRRQVEILRLVAQGLSNGQIASRLGLSEHTVKRHVANLLQRLGVSSRAAAAAHAAREGLL